MNVLYKYSIGRTLLISLIGAIFIVYPNITWLPYDLKYAGEEYQVKHIVFFLFRYIYYTALIFVLIKLNLEKITTTSFSKRFWKSSLLSLVAYLVFGLVNFLFYHKLAHFGSLVLFQVFIISILCSLLGHIFLMYQEQRVKEQEIEKLKVANLQSQYNALTNQINPHFFFNSLNGLTSLVRKKNDEMTLNYVNNLSDVFRYILQSDEKGLVTLAEELEFVKAFRYMMEVRFANKLIYKIEANENKLAYRLPVLSIIPLLDNVVVHNRIDSEHKMVVTIRLDEKEEELVVSNPIYPKISPPETNGTGLKNLDNRFMLLINRQIRIENNGTQFCVFLPLI